MELQNNQPHLLHSRTHGQHLGEQAIARLTLLALPEAIEHALNATHLSFDASKASLGLFRKISLVHDL